MLYVCVHVMYMVCVVSTCSVCDVVYMCGVYVGVYVCVCGVHVCVYVCVMCRCVVCVYRG